jgi:hypothetical protein
MPLLLCSLGLARVETIVEVLLDADLLDDFGVEVVVGEGVLGELVLAALVRGGAEGGAGLFEGEERSCEAVVRSPKVGSGVEGALGDGTHEAAEAAVISSLGWAVFQVFKDVLVIDHQSTQEVSALQ